MAIGAGAAQRTGWPALIALALLLAALQLWLRPLLPVDETRYLSVAWEMWSRGDFLVPYLNGEPYSHKPPLLFWLIHALWGLFGVSQWPARLLPVVLSLLALWASARLARRLWPGQPQVVPLVPWLLFGSAFWMNFYTLVQFDLLLVVAALAAWLGTLRAAEQFVSGWLLVALAIGLGGVSKGPVILVVTLPPLLLAPWWRAEAPRGGWWRWYLGAGAALLLGTGGALGWAIPAGQAGGETYRQAILWGQSAGRLVASFAHRGAWWEYLLWFPLMGLPWILWPALWPRLRQMPGADTGVRFCLAVLVPALLVFSLISAKQAKYLLPLLPLAALLAARALAGGETPAMRWRLWPVGVLLLVAGLALTGLGWSPHGAPGWSTPVARGWGPSLAAGSLLFFSLRLPLVAAVRGLALGTALSTAALYMAVVDPLAGQYQLQPLATRLAALQQQGHALAWRGRYHGQFQFLGRLRQPLASLRQPGSLRPWLKAHPDGYVLIRYPAARPDVPSGLLVQPYRSGALVLWPAQWLLRAPERLDALAGNA